MIRPERKEVEIKSGRNDEDKKLKINMNSLSNYKNIFNTLADLIGLYIAYPLYDILLNNIVD